MKKEIKVIEITQPIGTFFIGKINSNDLIQSSFVRRRGYDKEGVQRDISIKREMEIESYCKDPDATFPTPIILAVDSSICSLKNDDTLIEYEDDNYIFEIIDGQHRVGGISKANNQTGFSCELVVVLMFDLTEEEKAYVFSTINSNQTKVDKSLIYDLFELSTKRSPLKTCHYIARIMNSKNTYPFYQKLKMLGKKEHGLNTLSQGTFVKGLVELISKNPQEDMIRIKNGDELLQDEKLPLRNLFINEKDDIILKILKNYFTAVSVVFEKEWNSNDYILTKTTGYLALMKAFGKFYNFGIEQGRLDEEFFVSIFKGIKNIFKHKHIQLISEEFQAGGVGQNRLKVEFENALMQISKSEF
ncbi:DGQHR domain-containing protein [Streptococcus infantis]|uniref:DGQHR domain-containing protein n=1 Tax=Streptococcus infantis TaxID=68892 RepID=UPI0039C3411E